MLFGRDFCRRIMQRSSPDHRLRSIYHDLRKIFSSVSAIIHFSLMVVVRFSEVSQLDSYYWLVVHGKLETRLLSPKTLYTAYFVFKFNENYVLNELPVDTFVTVVGGGGSSSSEEKRSIYLNPDDNERNQWLKDHFPRERGDGWMEIEMGNFFNDREFGGELRMALKEIEGLHRDWKGGFVVEGIELRPAQSSKDSLSPWKSFLNEIQILDALRMIMIDREREEEEEEEMVKEVEAAVDFNILPEGCISNILSLTSPRDVCRSSLVSSSFKSAAESDAVWERFLPSDYAEIISRSSIAIDFSCSKKYLYYRLCHNPLLIDGGSKSFALEKWSGKKCFMLGANEMKIIWEDTFYWRCMWRLPRDPDSRFAEVIQLDSYYWLELHWKLDTRLLSPKTLYTAYFVFKFNEKFVLDELPVHTFVTLVGGEGSSTSEEKRSMYLDPDDSERSQLLEGHFPWERGDGWMEIEMGHFLNDGECGGELQMTLKEIEGLHSDWKAGFVVEGIELRPAQSG